MPDEKDFIAIFKVESEERLTKLDKGLIKLEKYPDDPELVRELNREAHTLKGAARVFGFYEIQEIAHRIEDIFDRILQKRLAFNPSVADGAFKGLDAIRTILEKIAKGEQAGVDSSGVCKVLEACLTEEPKAKAKKQKAEKKPARPSPAAKSQSTAHGPKMAAIEEYIRVPVSKVNKLLNLIGEVVINNIKNSSRVSRTKRLFKLSKEVQKNVSALNEEVQRTSPAENEEIVKLLNQCDADARKVKDDIMDLYEDISSEAFQLEPVVSELREEMKEIRMLPCSTIFDGFPRMVRDIASQQGKEINLEISGEETELDKKVLEGIKAPLIHILRNCIDHGIEKPKKRAAAGKPKCGRIKLAAFHEGGNVVITVEDDGEGIDVEAIKQTALKKNLISAQELKRMRSNEIKNIVFMNGYSTSPTITDVSGRGIGLDVVKRDIQNLKGQTLFDTKKNKGTKFTMILPLTIAIVEVLLLKAGRKPFAIPTSSIVESLKVKTDEISSIEARTAIQVRGHTVPVVRLEDVLELPRVEDGEKPETKDKVTVVIATSLEKQVGFIVDEILHEEEVFIKSLGEYLGKVKNVGGAAILGTGDVVVILDVSELIAKNTLRH